MTTKDYTPFDFRTVESSDDSIKVLKTWLHRTADTFHESWESISATSVQMECGRIQTKSFDDALNAARSECIGYRFLLGENDIETLAYVSCKDLTSLLGYLTGPSLDESEDRPPTSIEISLCHMIFETLASGMSESWPGNDVLQINVKNITDALQRSRVLPGSTLMLEIQLKLTLAGTEALVYWLVPKGLVQPLLDAIIGGSVQKTPADIRGLVKEIELDLECVLGVASISMSELAELSPGDVIKLDQGIHRPLLMQIDDKPQFQCWPGRIGNQQCVEISCLL